MFRLLQQEVWIFELLAGLGSVCWPLLDLDPPPSVLKALLIGALNRKFHFDSNFVTFLEVMKTSQWVTSIQVRSVFDGNGHSFCRF